MNTKRTLFLLLFFCSSSLFAQQDNYTFFKLIVSNADNKIMLVKWGGSWEIPGTRYNMPSSIAAFVDTLALEHGITVHQKKLSGLFTFKYDNRPALTIMQYYTAQYNSGKLKVPESCEDIGWFTVKEAMAIIPYPEMKRIVEKITGNPKKLWGAAVKKSGNNEVDFTEDFYELN
jgi:hypothetical protein